MSRVLCFCLPSLIPKCPWETEASPPGKGRDRKGREGRAAALQLQFLQGALPDLPWVSCPLSMGTGRRSPVSCLASTSENQGASGLWIEEVTFCFSKEVLLLSASVVCVGGRGSGRVHQMGLLDLLLGEIISARLLKMNIDLKSSGKEAMKYPLFLKLILRDGP